MEDKKQTITASKVIECLDNGMDRKTIAEHFGITKNECAVLFQNPTLKGLKPRKKNITTFVFVDDVTPKDSPEIEKEEESTESTKEENPVPNLYGSVDITDKIDETPEEVVAPKESIEPKKPWGQVVTD